jgi:hypothetical protein
MSVDAETIPPVAPASPAALNTDRDDLLARLDVMTAEEGHIEPVGPHHWAFFEDVGTTLLVTFETLDQILAREAKLPLGHTLAAAHGWSHLCLIADGQTWYRDAAVYAHFDRLVDDAFFEDFDKVMFYGQGMGGYAACAFAVAAPGANVLALNAPATLDPSEASWDRRFATARRLDFSTRYGYAPDMLEGAGKVVVIHDPTLREEAMHAALFRAPWVTRLSTPHLGARIEWALRHMGLLPDMIEKAMNGTISHESFAPLWRKRRDFAPYLRALLEKAEANRRKSHAVMICRSVTRRLRAPHFARRLARLTGANP